MAVYVVRHACAGDKDSWQGDDDLRPLDDVGLQQADALVAVLAERSPRRILTSPSWRCVQSVGPLARQTGLSIEHITTLSKDMEDGR